MENINIEETEIWKQIQEQVQLLKQNTGLEDDNEENLKNQLEELYGLTEDDLHEMDEHTKILLKKIDVKVQLINDLAVYPKYAYPTDSGFDLHSVEEVKLTPFGRALVSTGIKVSFDEGYELQIRPKSGLSINHGITVLNTPGTVDAGYTGEIKVIVFNTNNYDFTITKGMKIAQAVFAPVQNGRYVSFQKVDGVEEKDRGNNGFGSTGI
jgi:dUTP pyrophosphatase